MLSAALPVEAANDPFKLTDRYGNSLPDFSTCGTSAPPPCIPTVVTLYPVEKCHQDDTARIQAAIDDVSQRPLFSAADAPTAQRGAIYLSPGTYRIHGTLRIRAAGVVLRGDPNGATVIVACGTSKRTLIALGLDASGRRVKPTSTKVPVWFGDDCGNSGHVPVGSRVLSLAGVIPDLVPGDRIIVSRPGTTEWIHAIGMDNIPNRPNTTTPVTQWDPTKYSLDQERVVTAVRCVAVQTGQRQLLEFDPPLVMDLRPQFGGGVVYKYNWTPTPPVQNIGLEHLQLVSEYKDGCEDDDEEHCTLAVSLDHCADCWVSNVNATRFVSGFKTGYNAFHCTIADCSFNDPASLVTGGRRYGFETDGMQILVIRCRARRNRHAFVTSSKVKGPCAFVHCVSEDDLADTGPHHRWATGILYDCVSGGQINCQNRGWMGSGHGWSGAFHVYWNCEARRNAFQSPPFATNWIVGHVGKDHQPAFPQDGTDAHWHSKGCHVTPRSLYEWQVERKKMTLG